MIQWSTVTVCACFNNTIVLIIKGIFQENTDILYTAHVWYETYWQIQRDHGDTTFLN